MSRLPRVAELPFPLPDWPKRRGGDVRRIRIALALTLTAIATSPAAARAAVPLDVGYQGRLLDTAGHPLAGPVDLELRIFDLQTDGTPLYTEQHATVALVDGVFQVLVGTGTPQSPAGGLEAALTGGINRWLELVANGEVLAPRQPFSAVPFAFEADLLGGKHLASLVQKNEAASISAPMLASGAVTTASLAPGAVTTASLANGSVTAAKVQGGPGSGLDADTVDGIPGSAITTLQSQDATLQTQLVAAQTQITALQTLFAGVSRSDGTLQFSGMNVQVVSGAGATDAAPNGLGNLIVGYNEPRGGGTDQRYGSHNLIVGVKQNFTSFGGLVAGYYNAVTGPYASVSGGFSNFAIGNAASVSGGDGNISSGSYASVSGGVGNEASGSNASVSGGLSNKASGGEASVSGGAHNEATGVRTSVGGGECNRAGPGGAIDCPFTTTGYMAVSGGFNNWASGTHSSVTGGQFNQATEAAASVDGGLNNVASGNSSAVGGGSGVSATAANSWKAGSLSSP